MRYRVWVEIEEQTDDGEPTEYTPMPDFSGTGPYFDTEEEAQAFALTLHRYGETLTEWMVEGA